MVKRVLVDMSEVFYIQNQDKVIGILGNDCSKDELSIELQDQTNLHGQQFYKGRKGELFSVMCPGKVLGIKSSFCDHGQLIELVNYENGNKFQQWKSDRFNNIYSVECGRSRVFDSVDETHVRLNSRRDTVSQIWTHLNRTDSDDEELLGLTCLYDGPVPNSSWVLAVEGQALALARRQLPPLTVLKGSGAGDVSRGSADNSSPGPDQFCYPFVQEVNKAYSQAFENFIQDNNLVIHDPSDEDSCRHAREVLGFDADYNNDARICQEFRGYEW